MLYIVIIPFCSSAGGGDQDTTIEVELTEDRTTFSGALSGAATEKYSLVKVANTPYTCNKVPAGRVVMLRVVLYGPIPTSVAAAILNK